MAIDRNKALIRQYMDTAFNTADFAQCARFFAPTFVDHDALTRHPTGAEELRDALTIWHAAFPNTHVTIEDMVAEADKVVVRLTLRATHLGPFMNIPATGRQVTVSGINIFRIADGKIVERWGNSDASGLMRQLGGDCVLPQWS